MSDPNVNLPQGDQTAGTSGTPASINTSSAADDAAKKSTQDPPNPTMVLHNAFMLGGAIVELKSRIQTALVKHNDSGLRLASVWRASFNRIAALQVKAFPKCATARTLYEPPRQQELPYLYKPEPDLANVGDYADVGISGKNDAGPILEDFALYEVTRRAINCLSLLYVKEEESLIPDVIKEHRDHLVEAILKAGKNPDAGGGDTQAAGDASPQDPLQQAKAVLTERTGKFLDAWDGYARENYYVGGGIPNDDLELVAYEAGHSMSSFSWGIGATIAQLDQKAEATKADYIEAWQIVFRDRDVNRLQHQISALSSRLDDAYYLDHQELKRPASDAVLVAPNPDLPSQAIQAVKRSLDYWQRTVNWIPDHVNELRDPQANGPAPWSNAMRLALAEQANIWQTLMTGQQSLRAYNMESVTHEIMQDVTSVIQQSVSTDFKASVQQAEEVMKAIAAEVKDAIEAVGRTAADGMETLFRSFVRSHWIILAVIAGLFILLVVVAFAVPHQINSTAAAASGGVGITGIVSAILGYLGLGSLTAKKAEKQSEIQQGQEKAKMKVENQAAAGATGASAGSSSLLTRIEGAAQQTGTMILQALERGYEQARIELDGLGRSVAVAYPLVEFFGLTFELKSDVSFLTQIIWSDMERHEEITRVTRAAFGPLAVFMTPSAQGGKSVP